MYQKLKKIIIVESIIITLICSLAMSEQLPTKNVTLSVLPKVTKGFPVVIKIIAQGPLKVYNLSIFDEGIPITVYLASKSDGKEYIIKSYQNFEAIGSIRSGGPMMDLTYLVRPPINVPKGKKYTMLFDLWSLSPRLKTETALTDIPAGQYSIHIEFNPVYAQILEKIKSDSIDLELVEPTNKEQQYIQKVRESGLSVSFRDGVSWVKVLRRRAEIPSVVSSLTQISKDQISFHKLISDVNIADEQSRNESIQEVNEATLPEFFEPERQLLLLELKGNPGKEREDLLQKYPQLQGMVEELNDGKKPFLSNKERSLERAKLRRQSAEQKNPVVPSKPN